MFTTQKNWHHWNDRNINVLKKDEKNTQAFQCQSKGIETSIFKIKQRLYVAGEVIFDQSILKSIPIINKMIEKWSKTKKKKWYLIWEIERFCSFWPISDSCDKFQTKWFLNYIRFSPKSFIFFLFFFLQHDAIVFGLRFVWTFKIRARSIPIEIIACLCTIQN